MLRTLTSFLSTQATSLMGGESSTVTTASAASRVIPTFESASVPRTFEDRTGAILNRLEDLPRGRGPLAENYHWLVVASKTAERPYYARATYHIDRLLQLDPWCEGENTEFEYLSFQVLQTILQNRDIASFMLYVSVMGKNPSIAAIEDLARYEKMGAYFGLPSHLSSPGPTWAGYGEAVEMIRTIKLFHPVRSELLRFFATAALKREKSLPAAGTFSDAYLAGPIEFVEAFGYGLEHPELAKRVREAIGVAAAHPTLGFLKMNRLAHVLMSREMEEKISELVPESEGFLKKIAGPREGLPEFLKQIRAVLEGNAPAEPPSLLEILDGADLKIEESGAFRKLVEESGRKDAKTVHSIYFTPEQNGGRAKIIVQKSTPHEEKCLAAHEAIHLGQVRRNGHGWVEKYLAKAEREALAGETLFRLQNGDRRLYDILSSLSPSGFEAGLMIAAEQLYFRLRNLPV